MIKLIIDTVIHGYTIHTIYGWSLHLLGACWDSVTNLILHLSRKPQTPPEETKQELQASQPESTPSETIELSVHTPIPNIYPQL